MALYRWDGSGSTERVHLASNGYISVVDDTSGRTLENNVTYVFKARAESQSVGSQYSFKVWPQGEAEPANWDLTLQTGAVENIANGSILLLSHYVNATFGDVSVTPLAGSNMVLSSQEVTVERTAAVDNVMTGRGNVDNRGGLIRTLAPGRMPPVSRPPQSNNNSNITDELMAAIQDWLDSHTSLPGNASDNGNGNGNGNRPAPRSALPGVIDAIVETVRTPVTRPKMLWQTPPLEG
ncbi:MAG: hypothetical protein R3C28_26375 [Pirellulaceae bacterium]